MRKGVAMIELIFAIVIMAFTMLSLPMLMTQVKQSNSLAVQQESIAEIASHVNLIMTYPWDDVQTKATNEGYILLTVAGLPELKQKAGTQLRGSRTVVGSRLYSIDPLVASAALTLEPKAGVANPVDDVDDFDNLTYTLNVAAGDENDESDYIDQTATVSTTIDYGTFTAPGGTDIVVTNTGTQAASSNVKIISGTLNKVGTNKTIVLRAYSANIGGYNSEVIGGF